MVHESGGMLSQWIIPGQGEDAVVDEADRSELLELGVRPARMSFKLTLPPEKMPIDDLWRLHILNWRKE